MQFFKLSKKNPQKTTLLTRFSDGPEGNSVVCLAQKKDSAKKTLIKVGDLGGNEYFYDSIYADEIEANEDLFAISREIFCGDLIRVINPYCTPKYKRYYGKDLNELFLGADFIDHFKTWKASFNHSAQTILGYKINSEGDVEFQPGKTKPVRGLGTCAVLLTVLGRQDRDHSNWGLVEYDTHLQITLIDFGQCLAQFTLFSGETSSTHINTEGPEVQKRSKEEIECVEECIEDTESVEYVYVQGVDKQNSDGQGSVLGEQINSRMKGDSNWLNFTNSFDIINAVFQQYSNLANLTPYDQSQQQYVEPPLPRQLLQSQHTKCEIFETIHQLYTTPFSVIVKMANDNFKEFPGYKEAMLQDKKLVIEHLYNQFKDNKEYIAVQFINRCFTKLGIGVKLSELDNTSINYLLSVYTFLNPNNDSYKEALFCKQIRTMLKRDEDRVEIPDNEQMSFSHIENHG